MWQASRNSACRRSRFRLGTPMRRRSRRPTPSDCSWIGLASCAPGSCLAHPISWSSLTSPGDSTGSPSRPSSPRHEFACSRSLQFAIAWPTGSMLLGSVRRRSRVANRASAKRSLGATDLLDDAGRVVFRRLAAFVGGWTYEAAEAVAGDASVGAVDTVLERLADQSLIQMLPGGETPRFTMLATIGEFANDLLASGKEAGEVMRRHVNYF